MSTKQNTNRPKRTPEHVQKARAEKIKEGMVVEVTLDVGNVIKTRAASDPWRLGHGDYVVKLLGFSGGYSVMRVRPMA